MEDFDLEPLASEINTRSTTQTSKGLWSSRVVDGKSKSSGKTSAEIWAQGLKESETSASVYSLLAEFRSAGEDCRYVQALSAFREAANLSRTNNVLKAAVFESALKEIKALTANNWRVALALLTEASTLESIPISDAVRNAIDGSAREETISNALAEFKPEGDLEQAHCRLTRALQHYPGDERLQTQLALVSKSLAEKRGVTERKTRVSIMSGLRDEFARSTELEDADKFARMSESALGPYRSDGEIFALYRDIQLQAQACRNAARALSELRPAECLQECGGVLHFSPQHNILLALRKKGRQFVYADESKALVQVGALFEEGPLADAQETCRQAQLQFPESSDLRTLSAAIQQKESTIRSLLETGEASLLKRDVGAASEAFLGSHRLLPMDPELADHISILLQSHARTEIDQDWRAFEAAVDLIYRIQPDRPLPADLLTVIRQRKQHAETVRLQAEAIHKTAERGLQPDVLRDTTSPGKAPEEVHRAVPAVTEREELAIVKAGIIEPGPPPATPFFDRITVRVLYGVAAILLCAILLAWFDHQIRAIQKDGPAMSAAATPPAADGKSADGHADDGSAPKPATLEIRGAEPGTQVKVDNVPLGAAVSGSSLTRELSSGDHVVELDREGYTSKRIALHFAPGELALLTGSEIQLQSTDASLVSTERRDWNRASQEAKVPAIEAFLRKYPSGSYAAEAKTEIRQIEWQSVDRTDPAALQAFVASHPGDPNQSQARDLIQSLNRLAALRAEQNDWQNLNKNSKVALSAFVAKYPNSVHAGSANGLIVDLDKQAAAQAAIQAAIEKPATPQPATTTMARAMDVPRREELRQPAATTRANLSADATPAESAAVLDVIGRFANAWNSKDYRSIMAIEPDLDRRTLKAQLSPVKAVFMRISPVAPPEIKGSQATIVCRRQADETFTDGSLKQNPESIVTYVLSKRNGSWGIEATR